uniref:Uncharacterized protein n=1 Tax=Acrobeloides nanus TaxID=290746 RepID=A0A914E2B2_9BILA
MSNGTIVSDYYDFDQTHFLTLTQYRIVGGIIFTYVTAALLLHIPVMWIFITKKEFYENSTYILMFHLGLGDIFVIVDWQLACLMMIFPKKFTPTATAIGWVIFDKMHKNL